MLNALKNNYSLQIILFVLIPLFLWIPSFISPPEVVLPDISGPIYNFLYNLFKTQHLLAVIVAFILVLLQGVLFNYLFTSYSLVPKTTFFPAVLFTLCFSYNPELHTISPILFVNFILLYILHNLFKAYNSESAFDAIFNIGVGVGLCILVYPYTWCLLLLIPIVIITYRLFHWRIWIISILGLLAPWILAAIYYWFVDKLNDSWITYRDEFHFIPHFWINTSVLMIILSILTIILFIIVSRTTIKFASDNIMSTKKRTLILFFTALLFLYFSFYDIVLPLNITFLAFFFAFGFTHILFKKMRPLYKNILFLILLITIILGNFL